jgi:subtilisin family serine protease
LKKRLLSIFIAAAFTVTILNSSVQAVSINNSLETLKKQEKIDDSDSHKRIKEKIMQNFSLTKKNHNYKKGELIVKIAGSKETFSKDTIEKQHNIKFKRFLKDGLGLVSFDTTKYSLEQVLEALNQDVNIEYAEPDYKVMLENTPEEEPNYEKLWGLRNQYVPNIDINVEPAWNITTGSPEVVVGVIDSGTDINHPELKDKLWVNSGEIPDNIVDDDNNGFVDDINGWDFINNDSIPNDENSHGTHVAGTIAADDNGIGIVGVAPNVKVMTLKVGNSRGEIYKTDVIDAINYGVSKGIRIFNCSYGGTSYSQAEYDAMNNSNALFLAAAGNGDVYGNGVNNDILPMYPSSYNTPNVLSVASIDKNGSLSRFSNYGSSSVDIAAPGSDIYSTIPGSGYGMKSGTSMATPHVTGVAALVLSRNLWLSVQELRSSLMASTHRLSSLNGKVATGAIVDASGAIVAADPSKAVIVTDIVFSSNSIPLSIGTSIQVAPTVLPSNATDKWLNWTSDNTSIVTVSSAGKITAVGAGSTVIRASSANGSFNASCEIVVNQLSSPVYYEGDKFQLKVFAPQVLGDGGLVYFIKPDGTEESYSLEADTANGYYYYDFEVNNDEYFYSSWEIDAMKDYGTWEIKYVSLRNTSGYIRYYNEKYYSVSSASAGTLNFDASKFTIASPDGIIKDETNDLSNNSMVTTPGNVTVFEKDELSQTQLYAGNSFNLKLYAKDSSGILTGLIYFIKPDGTEESYLLDANPRGGYYFLNMSIDDDEYYYSSMEIDPEIDYGTWEIKYVSLQDVDGNYTRYYNEKYYSINTSSGKTADFEGSKFTVVSTEGIIKDDTVDQSNNSKVITPGNITTYGGVEVTKKEAYLGENITLKIFAKDTSGIMGGLVYLMKPNGQEKSYLLEANPRGGYYYLNLEINDDEYFYSSQEIDPSVDAGTWQIRYVWLQDVNGTTTRYYNKDFYTTNIADFENGKFTVYNSTWSFSPTDVNKSGSTDIVDLALVSSLYNSKLGDSAYKSEFDLNMDYTIDIFDLVLVSKAM